MKEHGFRVKTFCYIPSLSDISRYTTLYQTSFLNLTKFFLPADQTITSGQIWRHPYTIKSGLL